MLVEYALRLMNISLAIILGYTLVMMAWGLWMSRQVKGSSDFFVAGRSLGPGLIAGTFLAANIGAGSTVGAAGLGYRDGLAAWWWVGSAAVGSFFLAMWVGPRIRALAAKHDLRTVGDFLEFRYDRRVRAAVSALLWVGSLAILSGQLIALAWILNIVAGLPKWLGCLTGGTVVTAYFASGGLLTSVKMNVLQLAVKFFGFALALPLALAAVGGFEGLRTMPVPSPGYWHWWQNGSSGWMYLAMLAPAFIISPGLLQKVYGARDDRAVRVGVGVNAFVLLLYVAGHETTVNLIGNGTLALLRHPDELRRWAADPSIDAQAIDELLRYDGPVQQTVRVPLQPVVFGDVEVPANTMVMTVLGAANHDPSVFDDPHTLRLDRPNSRNHLAFAAGVHYCLGASLAKLEATVAIGSLIRRFPDVELAGDPSWRDRLTIRGVDRLPLTTP